jgi:hypothetical protein
VVDARAASPVMRESFKTLTGAAPAGAPVGALPAGALVCAVVTGAPEDADWFELVGVVAGGVKVVVAGGVAAVEVEREVG